MKLSTILFFLFIIGTNLNANQELINAYAGRQSQIQFIENLGQLKYDDGRSADDVLFTAEIPEGQIYIRRAGLSFVIIKPTIEIKNKYADDKMLYVEKEQKKTEYQVCRTDMDFTDANYISSFKGVEQNEEYINYYVGKTELKNVHTFKRVLLENVYNKIDFEVYANDSNQIEYDFIVKPGGNPQDIAINFINHNGIKINEGKSLVIDTDLGRIEQYQPVSYQNYGNVKQAVNSYFKIDKNNNIKFNIETYDKTQNLRIDPVTRIWVTAWGGKKNDYPYDCALDDRGFFYIAGETESNNLIVDVYQRMYWGGNSDGFVIKYNYSGQRVWSTYIGGESADACLGITKDNNHDITIGGWTWSKEFPADTFQKYVKTSARVGFILKLDENGNKKWASYIGDTFGEWVYKVLSDKNNNLFVTGFTDSPNFYNTFDNSKPKGYNAFLMKFDKDCKLQWSRVYGGDGDDKGISIALDSTGNIYMLGEAKSITLPKCTNAPNDTIYPDIFFSKFDSNCTLLWTKRIIGKDWDFARDIEVDSKKNVVVLGNTKSDDIFTNGFQKKYYYADGILQKSDSNGKLIWSTYIGSTCSDMFYSITVDRFDNIYATGGVCGTLIFPLTPIDTNYQDYDIFLIKIDPSGMYEWCTFYGWWGWDIGIGVAVDNRDNILIAGQTNSWDYKYDYGLDGNLKFVTALKYTFKLTIPYKIKPLCIGKADSIQYLVNKKKSSKIKFIAELSDTLGSFTKAIKIGEYESDTSGFIPVSIPMSIAENKKYKLRIRTSDSSLSHIYPENVRVIQTPKPTILSSIDTVCQGNESLIIANPGKDLKYEWRTDGGTIINTDSNTSIIRWDSVGIQNFILIERNLLSGCEQSISKNIFVHSQPIIFITTNPELCQNDSILILDNVDPKGGNYSGIGIIDNTFYPSIAGIGTQNITYKYTDSNGCSNSANFTIKVNPNPNKPKITTSGNYLIAPQSIGYQWYKDGNKLDGVTYNEFLAKDNGKYTVIVFNQFGCPSDMSDPFDFINGIEYPTDLNIEIFPQPVEDILNIFNYTSKSDKIIISNILGENILTVETFQELPLQINVSGLAQGMYFVRIGDMVRKFVKV
jgi:hypothetical protein